MAIRPMFSEFRHVDDTMYRHVVGWELGDVMKTNKVQTITITKIASETPREFHIVSGKELILKVPPEDCEEYPVPIDRDHKEIYAVIPPDTGFAILAQPVEDGTVTPHRVMVEWYLYDGTDSILAEKILEEGKERLTPENLSKFKYEHYER